MRAVLTVGLAASGFAFCAFLATTAARSLGVLLVAMFSVFVLASLGVLLLASLGVFLLAACFFLLAAFFLVLVALVVLSASICCSAHHGHDHHGTEQNLFHIFLLLM